MQCIEQFIHYFALFVFFCLLMVEVCKLDNCHN